ncbi:MAG: phosphoadenosine phosphosulfate reductase, partial [Gammaproteobacteria bacterium HGW-Gammaproteobacteria-7]
MLDHGPTAMTPVLPEPLTAAEDDRALATLNAWLEGQSAQARAAWALERLAGVHVMSSSFGAQSAVLLHLMTRLRPDLPVI